MNNNQIITVEEINPDDIDQVRAAIRHNCQVLAQMQAEIEATKAKIAQGYVIDEAELSDRLDAQFATKFGIQMF